MTTILCPFDNLLVIDFATTSEKNNYDYPPEIIQFSVSVVDVENKRIREDVSFNEYCKPSINMLLTAYCIETTGVSQDNVDSARSFEDVYNQFLTWLGENNFEEKNFAFVCQNEETIWKYAQYQFILNKTPLPRILRQWFDASFIYLKVTRQPTTLAPQNYLVQMMDHYGIAQEGQRFDSRSNTINLARIALSMLIDRCRVDINSQLSCVDRNRRTDWYWNKSIVWQTDRDLFFRIEKHILPLMYMRQVSAFNMDLFGVCPWCRQEPDVCTGLEYEREPTAILRGFRQTSRQVSDFVETLQLTN